MSGSAGSAWSTVTADGDFECIWVVTVGDNNDGHDVLSSKLEDCWSTNGISVGFDWMTARHRLDWTGARRRGQTVEDVRSK